MIEKHIPAGLLLKMQASNLASGSDAICKRVHDHFHVSGLPFFREYTDHSFRHSIDVFKSACDMIPEETFNVLSPDDLNVLLIACLIHDAGLHITEDVFLRMIQSSNISIPEFDKKSWSTLWAEFIAEAQRFSEKKLISLFGDSEPVREPPKSSDKLSQRDRLLIGEFLRRHHPRFAHEFITGRTLDANGDAYSFLEFEASILDIIGVTARSHGLALRDTFSYLEKHFDLRDFNRIHIVYVMVLVRIADFLQIQSARAPTIFKKLHSIRSPFSLGEWRLHHSVDNITTSSMDPEAIMVSATPKTLKDYLKLEKWSQDFQIEIDKSWAILGEVYGRFTREALDKLKLNIRRIRTNFEDVDALQQKVGFVPAPIRFTVSEPELLRLLMEPLYGENPTYGLRELTQNAADSVNELEHRLTVTGIPIADRLSQTSDIEVEIHGDPQWSFTIRDRGTGMTLDTIKNYFLKAGASFRNSDLWKHIFTDSKGKSEVARTGRFGVGALSAYLIGERVQFTPDTIQSNRDTDISFNAVLMTKRSKYRNKAVRLAPRSRYGRRSQKFFPWRII